MKALIRLIYLLREFTGEVLLSLLLGVAAITAGIGLLGTSAYLIASAALKPSIADLQVAIVGVRFFGISRGVFRYLERLVSHSVNLRVLARLRGDFYKRVEPGAPANLRTKLSGDTLQRVMGDLETLENFYIRVLSPIVVAVVIITGVSLFVGGYAYQLGLILAAGLLTGGFIQPILSFLASRVHIRNLTQSKAMASARIVEALQGLEDIQVGNAQTRYLGEVKNEFLRSRYLQSRLVNINAISSGFTLLITNLTLLGLLCWAIPLLERTGFTGVSLAVVTLVTLASFEAVNPLPAAALNFNASLAAAERLFSIGTDQTESSLEQTLISLNSSPSIHFEQVYFRFNYEGDPILEDISFSIRPGNKIAIVGASGAGKSSLINLVLGFEQPGSGRILINDIDMRQLDAEWIRSLYAVQLQSVYLFNDTLRGNLLLANPKASDAELLQVIDSVNLSGWLASLPAGLDTWIGEHGMKMSGGERQRLALARVLLQDKPYVLLDEPTANLDRSNALYIMDRLLARKSGKGVLVITYDIALLAEMDEILVLSGGRITQRGTWKTLSTNEGDFREIFDLEKKRLIE